MAEKKFDAVASQNDMNFLTVQEEAELLLKGFSKVDTGSLESLNVEYLKFEEDTTYNLIFAEMGKMKNNAGQEIDAVVLINEEGEKKINGNTILVQKLSKVTQMPCYVRVITKKEVQSKNSNGSYLNMEVYIVPVSK